MAYSFLFGDYEGREKKPYWLLSGVCIGLHYIYRPSSLKASTLSYYYTTPPPPITSLGFFFHDDFFHLGIFFFSPLCIFISPPLYSHTHNSRWCAVWSRVLGREEMKENYTGLSASHYTSTFYFIFSTPSFLSFSSYSPLFFSLLREKKKKYKKNNR